MARITNEMVFAKFDEFNAKLDSINAKLDKVDGRMDGMAKFFANNVGKTPVVPNYVPTTPPTQGKGTKARPKKVYTVNGVKYNLDSSKYNADEYYAKAKELGFAYEKGDGTCKVAKDKRATVYMACGWLVEI